MGLRNRMKTIAMPYIVVERSMDINALSCYAGNQDQFSKNVPTALPRGNRRIVEETLRDSSKALTFA
jgi:hypothetical protein